MIMRRFSKLMMRRVSNRTGVWVSVSGLLLLLLIGVGGLFVFWPELPSYPSFKTSNHSIVTIPRSDCSFRPPDGVWVDVVTSASSQTLLSSQIPFRTMIDYIELGPPLTKGNGRTLIVTIEEMKLAPIGDYFGLDMSADLEKLRPTMKETDGLLAISYDDARVKMSPFMPYILLLDDATGIGLLSLNHLSLEQALELLQSVKCQ